MLFQGISRYVRLGNVTSGFPILFRFGQVRPCYVRLSGYIRYIQV